MTDLDKARAAWNTGCVDPHADPGDLYPHLGAALAEVDRLTGALSAAEKERDELRAALARLQAPASDLPPVGTRWGDIPDEVRARLPVGTRLEPPAHYHMDTVFVRRADGLWYADPDGCIPKTQVSPDRRILSYPERS